MLQNCHKTSYDISIVQHNMNNINLILEMGAFDNIILYHHILVACITIHHVPLRNVSKLYSSPQFNQMVFHFCPVQMLLLFSDLSIWPQSHHRFTNVLTVMLLIKHAVVPRQASFHKVWILVIRVYPALPTLVFYFACHRFLILYT
jgi:hypothetical protein